MALGVTGGIGAGKSEVLRAFARHGVPVISADEIVHDLLQNDPAVRESLRERWGEEIVGAGGGIDRAKVARLVFDNTDELNWLESVLHPRVADRRTAWLDQLSVGKDPPSLCAMEIPLLYETGGEAQLDAVLVVTAPSKLRRSRVNHATDDREQRLIPDAEKVIRADFTYENVGTLEELDAYVIDLIRELNNWSES